MAAGRSMSSLQPAGASRWMVAVAYEIYSTGLQGNPSPPNRPVFPRATTSLTSGVPPGMVRSRLFQLNQDWAGPQGDCSGTEDGDSKTHSTISSTLRILGTPLSHVRSTNCFCIYGSAIRRGPWPERGNGAGPAPWFRSPPQLDRIVPGIRSLPPGMKTVTRAPPSTARALANRSRAIHSEPLRTRHRSASFGSERPNYSPDVAREEPAVESRKSASRASRGVRYFPLPPYFALDSRIRGRSIPIAGSSQDNQQGER
jgi:hypothetical protein